MIRPSVTVIDYSVNNVLSVARGFEHIGVDVHFARTAEDLYDAQRIVLPGVGAFGAAMEKLGAAGLIEPLKEIASNGDVPLLGVCLGMQLLLDGSSEFGNHKGLALIPGEVTKLSFDNDINCDKPKVPHICWAGLQQSPTAKSWDGGLLAGLSPGDCVYFVHSFIATPSRDENCIATAAYYDVQVPAVIGHGKIWGCQFHPEKSANVGMQILKNFVQFI